MLSSCPVACEEYFLGLSEKNMVIFHPFSVKHCIFVYVFEKRRYFEKNLKA
jgi:hypothetical protein